MKPSIGILTFANLNCIIVESFITCFLIPSIQFTLEKTRVKVKYLLSSSLDIERCLENFEKIARKSLISKCYFCAFSNYNQGRVDNKSNHNALKKTYEKVREIKRKPNKIQNFVILHGCRT